MNFFENESCLQYIECSRSWSWTSLYHHYRDKFFNNAIVFFPIISGFDQAESLQWVKRGSGHLAQLIVSNWSSHSYFSEAPFMEKHYGFPNTPMLIQTPQFRVNDSPLDAFFKDKLTPQHILTTPKNTFENKWRSTSENVWCCAQWDRRFFVKYQLVWTICSISILCWYVYTVHCSKNKHVDIFLEIRLACTARSGLFLQFTHNLKSTRVVSQECPLPWIVFIVHMPYPCSHFKYIF